jgi:hypothetical protein
MEIKTKATEILEKHLGKDQCSTLFNYNEPLWDDIIEAINEALSINGVVGQSEQLPQDKFCKVCNLPTDGEKCYSKRCPI